MPSALRSLAVLGSTLLALAGCSTTYRLENNVQAYSGLPALPATPTYRFERLPSQAAQPGHEQLEALADPALYRAGLRRDDAAPHFSVLVTARVTRVLSPWGDPWGYPYGWGPYGWGWGGRYGYGYGWGPHWGVGYSYYDHPWYVREVGVLVRDVASNQVVFESHASSDGPWLDHSLALAAMYDAALQGFPNPPVGPRRVDVMVGEQLAVAAPAAGAPAAGQAAPAASAPRGPPATPSAR